MPYYDYECSKCEKQWESLHTIADRKKERCPDCGGKTRLLIGGNTITTYFERCYPVKITDLGPGPANDFIVHSKNEHKELLKRFDKESPAFM